jgi:hypothetical protein
MYFLCGALFGFLIAIGIVWFLLFLLGQSDKVETMAASGPARSRALRYTLRLITLTF